MADTLISRQTVHACSYYPELFAKLARKNGGKISVFRAQGLWVVEIKIMAASRRKARFFKVRVKQ